jgi:hypothetical protein
VTVPILCTTHDVSVKGRRRQVPAFRVGDVVVVTKGRFPKIAEIFDEYWLEADTLPDPHRVLTHLGDVSPKPDLFTFAQRVPDSQPRYDFHMEWDNVAVIPVSSHATWLREQISPASRRNIRGAEKKGVIVRLADFDETYVRGIMSIYNESPFRHGRKYWHYNKDFATVQAENGTYAERSTFLGAYFEGEMIGYMKIVWDTRTAAIMQIVSKMAFFDKRPNNALLSEAVRLCTERKVGHLLYEAFVYGNKVDSSLTRFKESNGFVRMNVPRYYVPLTRRGELCLRLGLHKNQKDRIPPWLATRLLAVREKFYARRMGRN